MNAIKGVVAWSLLGLIVFLSGQFLSQTMIPRFASNTVLMVKR